MRKAIAIAAACLTAACAMISRDAVDVKQTPIDGSIVSYSLAPGRGAPLVLLHGWASDSSVWERVLPLIGAIGPGLAVDAPGSGNSPRGDRPFSFRRYADAAAAIMARERLGSGVLVAHSFGAYAAREFARAYPERTCAIVLLDASFTRPFPDAEAAQRRVDSLKKGPWPAPLEARNSPRDASAETLRRLPEMHRRASKTSAIEWIKALLDDHLHTDDAVTAPLLLILAQTSTWLTKEDIAWLRSIAPSLEIRRVANVSHFLAWDAPGEIALIIGDFVKRTPCKV